MKLRVLIAGALAAAVSAAVPQGMQVQGTAPEQESGLIGRAADGGSILFIGNSFTYGAGSAVHYYREQTVTDLNNEGVGGVPALFKVFAEQAGLKFDVSVETRGGVGIEFHVQTKKTEISSRGWDFVIAHGHSLVNQEKPGDAATLTPRARNSEIYCGCVTEGGNLPTQHGRARSAPHTGA